mgnify:CR=1 FL=1
MTGQTDSVYVKKERENGHYWICIPKGKFRLSSHTAYIKEKWGICGR